MSVYGLNNTMDISKVPNPVRHWSQQRPSPLLADLLTDLLTEGRLSDTDHRVRGYSAAV